jgi:hypothetical protein
MLESISLVGYHNSGMEIRTRGEDTRVEDMLILPAALGGITVGYLIAMVASTTFQSATNAIVHSECQLQHP